MSTAEKGSASSAPTPSGSIKKIVLAYSGGLDTTVIIPWLKENYAGCEVIAFAADVGQECDWGSLEGKAVSSGASKLIVKKLVNEFVEDYLWPIVKAGSVYEGKYLLGTSAARPVIAKELALAALAEGADAVAHGCTGKGNDQLRFELGVKAFAPQLRIIAPWRIWDMQSREDEFDYLEKRGIPAPFRRDDSYSRDDNLWHVSHEGLDLEDPANPAPLSTLLKRTVPPEAAPDLARTVRIGFASGIPVSLDGQECGGAALLSRLNAMAGAHGVGILDMVENRVVGMKSRGVYETPGGTVIMIAHSKLEELCLDRRTLSFKQGVAQRLAEICYEGEWFSPLREALSAFVDSTQADVCGTVTVKLWKGSAFATAVESDMSLYDASLASFTTGPLFSHHDAEGFITLFGLPTTVRAALKGSYGSKRSSKPRQKAPGD